MNKYGFVTYDEAVTLFDKRRAAWLAEDLDAYLACFADDIEFRGPGGTGVDGIGAYRTLVERALKAVKPVAFEFHEMAVRDNRVLAEWTITLEVRATGKRLPYRGMSVCAIEDGRIRWWREYYESSLLTGRAP
jgi:ketosteroid isomerase-like protein